MGFFLLTLTVLLTGCLDPVSLGRQPVSRSPNGAQPLPMSVTSLFTPTGFFWDVWAPADEDGLRVKPEGWKKFLAYQSIKMFEDGCEESRMNPQDLLAANRGIENRRIDTVKNASQAILRYDTSWTINIQPERFFQNHTCTKFVYTPMDASDEYGGVFWLRRNNFGTAPGLPISAGATKITFYAKSNRPRIYCKFGAGVSNDPDLKPMVYYTPYVDDFGVPSTDSVDYTYLTHPHTPEDSTTVTDLLPAGDNVTIPAKLDTTWKKFTIDLTPLNNNKPLPRFELIGSFFWAITARDLTPAGNDTLLIPPEQLTETTVYDSEKSMTHFTVAREDTSGTPDYSRGLKMPITSVTFFVDGIQYE